MNTYYFLICESNQTSDISLENSKYPFSEKFVDIVFKNCCKNLQGFN